MATVKRDYYEILGVERNANGEELKRSYRKLAMEYHPDRNPGDAAAEARFKEVGEAYSVLSDPEKRQRYDQFGHADQMPDFGSFSFDSAFDLFDMFFGGGRRHSSGPRHGNDLRMNIDITFEESVFGAKRTIEVPRAGTCEECAGSGAAKGTTAKTCTDCGGQGQVRRTVNSIFGQMAQVVACSTCRGEGSVVEKPCVVCHGQGLVETRKTLEVNIPAGVDSDVSVRVAGEGEPGPRGGPSGDLYIGFRIAPHEHLVRHGNDLIYELPITLPQAVLGDTVTVPTVNGEHQLVIAPGTQHGKVFKIHGIGVPHVRSGRRGDQLCVVRLVVPGKLSSEETQAWEKLGGRTGKPAEVHKGFFDHLRDAFRG